MNQSGYQRYKEQSVNTMTKGEMLVLLYDEMVKRLSRAEIALNNKDYEVFRQSVQRVRDILLYLMNTLDRKYSISADLHRYYEFFMHEMGRLEAGRNPEIIVKIKPLIASLRDAFKEADVINSTVCIGKAQ